MNILFILPSSHSGKISLGALLITFISCMVVPLLIVVSSLLKFCEGWELLIIFFAWPDNSLDCNSNENV